MDWDIVEHLKTGCEIIVAVVTIGGLLKASTKKGRNFISRLFNAVGTIEKLQKEFQPNNGSTIRDSLNRMEKQLIYLQHSRKIQIANTTYGICECDQYGRVLDMNRKFYEMTGLSRDQCLDNGWMMAIDSNDKENVKKAITNAILDVREESVSFGMNGVRVLQHYYPIIFKEKIIGFMITTEEIREFN
jgi:PAS domain S-box-containing protein